MILLLHNRYRVPGGEERAVEDLAWLIETEPALDVPAPHGLVPGHDGHENRI